MNEDLKKDNLRYGLLLLEESYGADSSIQITPVDHQCLLIGFSSQRLISHFSSFVMASSRYQMKDKTAPILFPRRELSALCNNNFNGLWPPFHSPLVQFVTCTELGIRYPLYPICIFSLSVNNWKLCSCLVLGWGEAHWAEDRSGIVSCQSWYRFRWK